MLTKEQAEVARKQILDQLGKLPEDQVEDLKKQVKDASPEELESFIQQMQQGQKQECIFCKIIKGEIETVKIFEDKDLIAILDIMPASKGHVIVMPKQHVKFIQELSNDVLSKLNNFVKLLSPVLVDVMKAKGLSIYIPQGVLAGQNVDHFSINLIPRYEDDKIAMGWERKKQSNKYLEKVAEEIRKVAATKVVKNLEEEKEKLLKHEKVKEATEAEKIFKHVKKRRP